MATHLDWLFERRKHDGDDCLLWPFSTSRGYGQVKAWDKIRKAHRVMCTIAHGPSTDPTHEAAHSCGNTRCVNPKHLSWKSRPANQADSVAMGRFYNGGRRGKLDRDRANQIRALKGTLSQNEIAARFGVTFSTVAKIHRGELWRDAG